VPNDEIYVVVYDSSKHSLQDIENKINSYDLSIDGASILTQKVI
jgi:hypothetical protein